MSRPRRFPQEFRDRAVRLVFEAEPHHRSQWPALLAVAQRLGISHEALRGWVREAEVSTGRRAAPGDRQPEEVTAEVRRLRAENAELRRANEILRAASAFFARELDQPRPQ
jgi:transposase